MPKTKLPSNLAYQVTTVLAAIALVTGVLATAKLAYNLALFGNRYPYGGVLPDLTLGSAVQAPYFQKEEDCTYSQVYYGPDGSTREPSEDERKASAENEMRCLETVKQQRRFAREQDITIAAFFLLGGIGLLVARHLLMRE